MELTVQMMIKHSGKWYKPGETITGLSEQDYNRLKEMNADVANQGFETKGAGVARVQDPLAGGVKLPNRSEFVEYKKDENGVVWETYK